MTYLSDGIKEKKPLYITSLNWSGTASVNTYMTFAIENEFPSSFVTSLTNSSTEINLPVGQYFVQAYADYTRSNSNDNCQFSWFVNGNQDGHYGAIDFYNGKSSDVAETSFELTSPGVLRLKITAQSGNNITLNNSHCLALIWRV
jgi:hypothetical protein